MLDLLVCLVPALPLLSARPAVLETEHLPDPGLTLELPALEDLARADMQGSQLVARWSGSLGESVVRIDVVVLDANDFGFAEPEDVLSTFEGHHVEQYEEQGHKVVLGTRDAIAGEFGWVPYAATVTADATSKQGEAGRLWIECGLTPKRGWAVLVEATPLPDSEGVEAIEHFLAQGIRGEGEPRAWQWTDEEALAGSSSRPRARRTT